MGASLGQRTATMRAMAQATCSDTAIASAGGALEVGRNIKGRDKPTAPTCRAMACRALARACGTRGERLRLLRQLSPQGHMVGAPKALKP